MTTARHARTRMATTNTPTAAPTADDDPTPSASPAANTHIYTHPLQNIQLCSSFNDSTENKQRNNQQKSNKEKAKTKIPKQFLLDDCEAAPHYVEHFVLMPSLPNTTDNLRPTYRTTQTRWLIFSNSTTTDERDNHELRATTTTTKSFNSLLTVLKKKIRHVGSWHCP